jgi:hypothetical protein
MKLAVKQFCPVQSTIRVKSITIACVLALTSLAALAQVPPQAIEQFNQVIGNRVEAVTVLGGDSGAAGGIYTFRGGTLADVSVGKIGGMGQVAAPRPLGIGAMTWAPVLEGNLGHINAMNTFETGYLKGNRMEYDVLAAQGGVGARFHFTDHLSLAPIISGIYGHTENEFHAQNAVGNAVKNAASGSFVDWQIDTWTVAPALDGRYTWNLGRAAFEFSSHFSYFHTESFKSSSPVISIVGDSETWENKLDADVPLGLKFLGRELHTGGFFSRTELFGDVSKGLNADHVYTLNGRFVMDLLGKVWKMRWLGAGASYFFGDHVDGWTAGVDIRFQF